MNIGALQLLPGAHIVYVCRESHRLLARVRDPGYALNPVACPICYSEVDGKITPAFCLGLRLPWEFRLAAEAGLVPWLLVGLRCEAETDCYFEWRRRHALSGHPFIPTGYHDAPYLVLVPAEEEPWAGDWRPREDD